MKDPISGLRAACTKLTASFSPRPFRFSNQTTTLATRDVFKPRDSAARIRVPAVSPYRKNSLTSFNDFGLAEPILRALAEEKYVTPTPIQAQTIPARPAKPRRHRHRPDRHRQDRSLRAADPQSPVTKRLRPAQKPAACWCCRPTRELSGQIADSFRTYGRHIRPLAVALAIGGVPINPQVALAGARRRCPGGHARPPARSGQPARGAPRPGRGPGARRSRPHARHGLHP